MYVHHTDDSYCQYIYQYEEKENSWKLTKEVRINESDFDSAIKDAKAGKDDDDIITRQVEDYNITDIIEDEIDRKARIIRHGIFGSVAILIAGAVVALGINVYYTQQKQGKITDTQPSSDATDLPTPQSTSSPKSTPPEVKPLTKRELTEEAQELGQEPIINAETNTPINRGKNTVESNKVDIGTEANSSPNPTLSSESTNDFKGTITELEKLYESDNLTSILDSESAGETAENILGKGGLAVLNKQGVKELLQGDKFSLPTDMNNPQTYIQKWIRAHYSPEAPADAPTGWNNLNGLEKLKHLADNNKDPTELAKKALKQHIKNSIKLHNEGIKLYNKGTSSNIKEISTNNLADLDRDNHQWFRLLEREKESLSSPDAFKGTNSVFDRVVKSNDQSSINYDGSSSVATGELNFGKGLFAREYVGASTGNHSISQEDLEYVNPVMRAVDNFVDNAKDSIINTWENASEAVSPIAEKVSELAGNSFEFIKETGGDVLQFMQKHSTAIGVAGLTTSAIGAFRETQQEMANNNGDERFNFTKQLAKNYFAKNTLRTTRVASSGLATAGVSAFAPVAVATGALCAMKFTLETGGKLSSRRAKKLEQKASKIESFDATRAEHLRYVARQNELAGKRLSDAPKKVCAATTQSVTTASNYIKQKADETVSNMKKVASTLSEGTTKFIQFVHGMSR
jgi:hypothetical protein